LNGRISLLLLLFLAHGLVDTFASLIQPLWPDLQGTLALDAGAIQWAYVTWSLATSVSQLFFGYWGDRYRRRWLIWAGPALGVICLSCIGLVHSLATLNVLLVVGGLGIAAFHPEAAALAGASTPGNRSRAMSLFAVGGSRPSCRSCGWRRRRDSGRCSSSSGSPACSWGRPCRS
jgi:FSR family fosmidomycin resistance protein-like MFS transporter